MRGAEAQGNARSICKTQGNAIPEAAENMGQVEADQEREIRLPSKTEYGKTLGRQLLAFRHVTNKLEGRRIAPTKPRAARGKGSASVCKAAKLERLPGVLRLLGVDKLPSDVELTGSKHEMNGVERAYANMLDALQFADEVLWWDFEPVRLHIGVGRCWLKPDFIVRYADGHIEAIDTKGQRHASGIRGMRVAAKQFPQWSFRIVSKVRGSWVYEDLK